MAGRRRPRPPAAILAPTRERERERKGGSEGKLTGEEGEKKRKGNEKKKRRRGRRPGRGAAAAGHRPRGRRQGEARWRAGHRDPPATRPTAVCRRERERVCGREGEEKGGGG